MESTSSSKQSQIRHRLFSNEMKKKIEPIQRIDSTENINRK